MRKLIKILKPFGWLILLIFLLLSAQAACDLSLPSLMSNIINVGVQQNGIVNSVPRSTTSTGPSRTFFCPRSSAATSS